MAIQIRKIFRYPVKGLSAQDLERTVLTPGQGLPDDRRFAIMHGASTFDPANPAWRPKSNFLMLARNERLAMLRTDYDDATATLTIHRAGRQVARGQLTTPTGRMLIDQFFAAYMQGEAPGAPRILEAPGHMFSDVDEKVVSIINTASVTDLERVVKQPVDPLRFRGNLLIEGLPAWAEMGWIGKTIAIGEARLEVAKAITRCAATCVDPQTGVRDVNIPQALQRGYGHILMGVYARVLTGGPIRTGDEITAP